MRPLKIRFAAEAAETFEELPEFYQSRTASLLKLISEQPLMFPVRRRGIMEGFRYFKIGSQLFYYQATSDEIRIAAIVPGRMRQA